MLSSLGVEERQSLKALSSEAALPIALKTSPFPDCPSLQEQLSLFLKATAGHGSFSHCSTGMALLGWSFSSQRGFCIFTTTLPDWWLLCEGSSLPAPSLHTKMGEREERETF